MLVLDLKLIKQDYDYLEKFISSHQFDNNIFLLDENKIPTLIYIINYLSTEAGYIAFYQNDTSKYHIEVNIIEPYQDSGLGLAALKKLKTNHNLYIDYPVSINDSLILKKSKKKKTT